HLDQRGNAALVAESAKGRRDGPAQVGGQRRIAQQRDQLGHHLVTADRDQRLQRLIEHQLAFVMQICLQQRRDRGGLVDQAEGGGRQFTVLALVASQRVDQRVERGRI